MTAEPDEDARQWARQWKNAGAALARQRRRELREMSDAQALSAAENLLSLARPEAIRPERLVSSGLVAQQAILHRRSGA